MPLARDEDLRAARERLFVVPHGRHFGGLAARFELAYRRVESADALRAALREALAATRPMLIEACPVGEGSARRSHLLEQMAAAARAALAKPPG